MYSGGALEGLSDELIAKYFAHVDGAFQVRKRIRALTVFGEHDLGQRSPFPRIDLCLCRNVLIYFTPELQRRTLQLFAFSLRTGGYLVLGKAETVSPLAEFFVPAHHQHKVYHRHGHRVFIPPARLSPAPAPRRLQPRPGRPQVGEQSLLLRDLTRVRTAGEHLLGALPIGVVLVDSRYDIREINAAARRLMAIHRPAIGEDFVHLAGTVPHRALRAALDAALRGEEPAPLDDIPVETVVGDRPRFVQLTFHPRKGEADAARPETVMVLIQDVTRQVEDRRRIASDAAQRSADAEALTAKISELQAANRALTESKGRLEASNAELERVRVAAEEARRHAEDMMGRLAEQNKELVAANEQVTETNERLRNAHEEILLSTEEAQAATEEVETLNEELQATNEELETLNEELQATIEELNTTNADLEARNREMADLSRAAEADRQKHAAVLASMSDAVLVTDPDGKVVITNDAWKRTFGDTLPVPQDESGRPAPEERLPWREAAVRPLRAEFTVPDGAGGRKYYEATGGPVRLPDGQTLWGVTVIRDITDRSLRAIQDRFLATASHELRTPLVPLVGYLELLLKSLPAAGPTEGPRKFADAALTQARRFNTLVGDLVDVVRLQNGRLTLRLEELDLSVSVRRAVAAVRIAAGNRPITLTEPSDGALRVRGDPVRLEQVVMNLLNNALNHAPGSPVEVTLARTDGYAEVTVRDFGPGIPADRQDELFRSFSQVSRPGRPSGGPGLGLYICKELVAAHGGSIAVNSSDGQGAAFTLRLPLAAGGT